MYALLRARLPRLLAILVCVAIEAAAIIVVTLMSDSPFGAFSYFRL